jgi:hypothetical protein
MNFRNMANMCWSAAALAGGGKGALGVPAAASGCWLAVDGSSVESIVRVEVSEGGGGGGAWA